MTEPTVFEEIGLVMQIDTLYDKVRELESRVDKLEEWKWQNG